jgi:hypothetical protein
VQKPLVPQAFSAPRAEWTGGQPSS